MEPPSPSVYSNSPRSALHNRVSTLLSHSSELGADTDSTDLPVRASRKLRLSIAPRPSFRALAIRSSSRRPPSSTRSVIDPAAPQVMQTTPSTAQSPATPMTPQERLEALYADPLTPIDHTWNRNTGEELHTETREQLGTRTRTSSSRPRWTALFSRSSFKRHRVRTKATFSAVFGLILIITLAIYLSLAAAGIGYGLMFHILFIIFILALTTVFCHSLLTMCLLILKPTTRRVRHTQTHPSSLSPIDLPPEKPIPIVMAIDEEACIDISPDISPVIAQVRPPPPTYGVWRDTKRMDPNLVHWAKLPPSPDTPTYEEALRDIQNTSGRRPPSYVMVNGVLVETETEEQTERDLRHDSTVHPLERERVGVLFGETR